MTSSDGIFKRCGCRDTTARRLETACPRLAQRGHGSWYFHASALALRPGPEVSADQINPAETLGHQPAVPIDP